MAGEDLKPELRVVVSGIDLTVEVLNAIISIEIDLTRDIMDSIKLSVANPSADEIGRGYDGLVFTDSKIFMPGNQVDVYVGYAKDPVFVASGIIQKWLPRFPEQGVPTLDIVAHDAAHRLADQETAAEARTFTELDIGTIVATILKEHDIDIGEVIPIPEGVFPGFVTKKAGMTDYQFVKGLANLAGFEFKVRYDPVAKRWKGYFRPPTSDQTKTFTFEYMNGVSTLLNFEPQWGLRDTPSEVKVLFFEQSSRTWQELSSNGISAAVKDEVLGDRKAQKAQESLKLTGLDERLKAGLDSLERIRIGTGGVSVEIVAERPFPTAAAAERFAARWIRQHRDNFITGEGRVIGTEVLKPGDIHNLAGLGLMLDGEWELTSVRHVIDTNNGFVTHLFGNKIISL